MFKCPKCGERTVTYATKRTTVEFVYGRYRRCPTCGTKFTTIERLSDAEKEVYNEGFNAAIRKLGEVVKGLSNDTRRMGNADDTQRTEY